MLKWCRDLWRATWQAPPAERAYRLALALSLLLGVALRLNGYLGEQNSFWFDEALWGNRLLRQPLLSLGIRPVGFMGLTWLFVSAFGATEIWFRFLSELGALASLLLLPYVAARLLSVRALRVLLVLLFAIHPALVDYAKEFKPYSFEVLMHLVPIAVYLRYRETKKVGYLLALLGLLPIAFLFAYNIAFAFAGLLLLCALPALRRPRDWRLLLASVASGVLCTVAALSIYVLALSKVTSEERTESYWGRKYDVFYQPADGQHRVVWALDKLADMAALIGKRRELWSDPGALPEKLAGPLGAGDRWLWVGLSLAGLVAIARKQRDLALLLLMPLLCLVATNTVGKWPLGAFRTNMFACVYLFPLPFLGLDQLWALSRVLGKLLVATVALLCVVPGFSFGFDWHGHKLTWTRDHRQRQVIAALYAHRREHLAKNSAAPAERLLMDAHTYHSHDYYLNSHPHFRAKYQAFFAENFVLDKEGGNARSLVNKLNRRLSAARQPLWVVASKPDGIAAVEKYARTKAKILVAERPGKMHLILLLDRK